MSSMKDKLARLTPEQRALMLAKLKSNKRNEAELPIARVSVQSDTHPVSLMQRQIWFFDQLEPGNPIYNVASSVKIKGNFHLPLFRESVNQIIRRHETLRTVFGVNESGEPFQRIIEPYEADIDLHDLSGLPEDEKALGRERIVREASRKPFHLSAPPLMRLTLIRLREEEHTLVFVIHHIAADFWSIMLIMQETFEVYRNSLQGVHAETAGDKLQYVDAAHWQRSNLQGAAKEKQLDYWRKQLSDKLPVLELPIDVPRPPVQTFNGNLYRFALPESLLSAIKAIAVQEEATLFMALMAAYQVLLYRYTQQSELIVGFNTSGRTRRELEEVVGTFVNTLPLRSAIRGDMTYLDFLRQVRDTALDAMNHPDIPFDMLVEELQVARSSSHNPVFQAFFNVNQMISEYQMPGFSLTFELIDTGTSKFDLSLEVYLAEREAYCMFEYNTDLFKPVRMERMSGHFLELLNAIVANPDGAIGRLPMLSEAEKELLMTRWNDTAHPLEADIPLHEWMDRQSEQTPDTIAVQFEDKILTYRELNEQANRLARYMQKAGIAPKSAIGICMDRSEWFLIGILAIFKAGGIYVPIDPTYPKDRIAYMVEKAEIKLLLTSSAWKQEMIDYEAELIILDEEHQLISKEPAAVLPACSTSDDLAYIIFTSGSTGQPKGAAIYHRGMMNHLFAKAIDLRLTSSDILIQNASQSFDISVWQMFVSSLVGGKVIIYPNEIAHDPVVLLRQIAQDRATVAEAVPSLLSAYLQLIENGSIPRVELPHLRWFMLTGEALPAALARKWFHYYPEIALINAYGPTECSDDVTHYPMTAAPDEPQLLIPIGRTIINTQLYILDEHLSLVPIGVPGELYVAGIGVGQGYVNDPDRTNAAFLPHPFAAEQGERIYKTGDRAKYAEDGNILYLGRVDHQVKVRGFRIELGEIESVLTRLPQVLDAVVTVHEDERGTQHLIGYLRNDADVGLDTNEVREQLKRLLPDYMIPNSFIAMQHFPLTSNGKIDRKALPIPSLENNETLDAQQPSTEEEKAIAAIWAEVLKLKLVGIRDNFFDLGGNSLLATQIMYRMRTLYEVDEELTLREFFRDATISNLVRYTRAGQSEKHANTAASSFIEPIPAYPQKELHELSHAQQRFWFHYQYSRNESLGMVWPYELSGPLETEKFIEAFRIVSIRHDMMRTTIVEVDGKPFQKVYESAEAHVPFIDLSAISEAEQMVQFNEAIAEEKRYSFDLTQEFFFRIKLFKLHRERHVMLINAHHIGSDAWSHQVIMDDVSKLYNAGLAESALDDPVLQYTDYIQWQHDQLANGKLDEQRQYWLKQLAEEVSPPQLSYDNIPDEDLHRLEANPSRYRKLNVELSEQLRQFAASSGLTPYTFVLAGINIWLAKLTKQNLVTIGSTMFGRVHPDLERVCGLFINPVVLRTDLSGNLSGREILESVTQCTYDAFVNQGYTYDLVVQDIRSGTGKDQNLFTITFIGQNNASDGLSLEGVEFRPYINEELSRSSAPERLDELDDHTKIKDDLLISMYESSDGAIKLLTHYNGEKFFPETVDRFHQQIEYVLQQLVNKPSLRLSQFELEHTELLDDLDELFAGA